MLKTMPNYKPELKMYQLHTLDLPQMCPVSHNPQPGSYIRIIYRPKDKFLEVYSLKDYINEFVGGHPSGVRDMEQTIQKIAEDCSLILEVPVQVCATLFLDSGRIFLSVKVDN